MSACSTGATTVSRPEFRPRPDVEARLLMLIDAFSGARRARCLEGRTKLAKLDFFLRYPPYLKRALEIRNKQAVLPDDDLEAENIDSRMVRYRYGPWDPSYFAVLGRLIGKGLIEPVPAKNGIGYRTTETGQSLAGEIGREPAWSDTAARIAVLKRHLDLSGENLKKMIYENFREIADASWGTRL